MLALYPDLRDESNLRREDYHMSSNRDADDDHISAEEKSPASAPVSSPSQGRRPGRPPVYIFDKPDEELTEENLKLKNAVLKRRKRQNLAYQERKKAKKAGERALSRALGGSPSSSLSGRSKLKHNLLLEGLNQGANTDSDGSRPDSESPSIEESLKAAITSKRLLFALLWDRLLQLKTESRAALQALSIFPEEFEIKSAVFVIGYEIETEMPQAIEDLSPLFANGFVSSTSGRFQMNPIAKLFLKEKTPPASDSEIMEIVEQATDRYITYYQNILSSFSTMDMCSSGSVREEVLQSYDKERHNIEHAMELCASTRISRLAGFLNANPTVIRFCLDAGTRARHLQAAIEADLSRECANLSGGSEQRKQLIRLIIAYAESQYDMKSLEDAEQSLRQALDLLPQDESSDNSVEELLIKVLQASIRINQGQPEDASDPIKELLGLLETHNLEQTTYSISALSCLATLKVSRGQLDCAERIASDLHNALQSMGYDSMPIFANSLGILGMVHLATKKWSEAAANFGSALQIVANWSSRQWKVVPVHHCMDLDVWLMEGLALTFHMMELPEDARQVSNLAESARSMREMPCSDYDVLTGAEAMPLWVSSSRHIY